MSALAPSGRLDGPLARALALLSHAGDCAGLAPRAPARRARPLRRPQDLLRLLDEVDRATWSAAVLRAAFEGGLVECLNPPVGAEALAARLGLPRAVADALLDALVGFGLATEVEGRFALAPVLADLAARPGGTAIVRGALDAPRLQAEDLRARLVGRRLDLDGWRFTDPAVIASQGDVTALLTEAAIPKLALLPGLNAALAAPGARLLDVGAGAAALSIALCRAFPALHAVALEPADAPAEVAAARIAEAGLSERIALRRERVEDYDARDGFDLAFLPQMFLPDAVLPAALARVARALRPGGWLLAAVLREEAGAPAALARLKGLVWGGNRRDPEAVRAAVAAAGFRPVIRARGRETVGMICARRPRRGAAA